MYTVFRVMWASGGTPDVERSIAAVVADFPDAGLEPRRKGDGCVSDLSVSDSWAEHRAAILAYIHQNRGAVAFAKGAGARASVDCAVRPDDLGDSYWLEISLDEELLGVLNEAQINFAVTLYPAES